MVDEIKDGPDVSNPKETKVVYVGSKRFKKLKEIAIDVSHATREQITASQVMHFLIDNYSEEQTKMLMERIM